MPLITLESVSSFSAYCGAIITTEHQPVSLAAEQSSVVGAPFLEHDLVSLVEAVSAPIEDFTAFSPLNDRSEGTSEASAGLLRAHDLVGGSSNHSTAGAQAHLDRLLLGLSSSSTEADSDLAAHSPDSLYSAVKGLAQAFGELTVVHLINGASEAGLGSSGALSAAWHVEAQAIGAASVTAAEQYVPLLLGLAPAVSASLAHLSREYELAAVSNGTAEASTNSEVRLIGQSIGQATSSASELRVCLLKTSIDQPSLSVSDLHKRSELTSQANGSSEGAGLLEPWVSLFGRVPARSSVNDALSRSVSVSSTVSTAAGTSGELLQVKVHQLFSSTPAQANVLGGPIGGWPAMAETVLLLAPIQRTISLVSRRLT